MKQVLGDFDRPIRGLFRDGLGLVVTDQAALDKYNEQRDIILAKDKKIEELESKFNLLLKHIEKINGIHNI